jgi:hypothetical protein
MPGGAVTHYFSIDRNCPTSSVGKSMKSGTNGPELICSEHFIREQRFCFSGATILWMYAKGEFGS